MSSTIRAPRRRVAAQRRDAALEVADLSKSFYGVHALKEVDFSVGTGELVGLIGPNGSGKTVALDCISGFLKPSGGTISFEGRRVRSGRPHLLAKRGMARTFQSVRVFTTLSVRQSLVVAALGHLPHHLEVPALFGRSRRWPEVERRAHELIVSMGLKRVADSATGELSYGQRKLVAFAAAMMQRPRLLLLDEPMAAVNPTMANTMRDLIVDLHQQGTAILLVEHNIELVVDVCARLVVLDHGIKIADGEPQRVMEQDDVQEAYFGR